MAFAREIKGAVRLIPGVSKEHAKVQTVAMEIKEKLELLQSVPVVLRVLAIATKEKSLEILIRIFVKRIIRAIMYHGVCGFRVVRAHVPTAVTATFLPLSLVILIVALTV